VKPFVKRIASGAARAATVLPVMKLLEYAGDRHPDMLRVLCYHRIAEHTDDPDLYPGTVSAAPSEFAAQMAYVAANYRVLSMADLLAAQRRGLSLPRRSLLITFDDAYEDFAEHAWPTLCRFDLPATLFVPTAYPDRDDRTFWWDRLHQALVRTDRREPLESAAGRLVFGSRDRCAVSFKRVRDKVKSLAHDDAMELVDGIVAELGEFESCNRVLGWDALRGLAHEGVTMGSHTQTHPLLNRITHERIRDELAGSITDLRRELGSTLPIFAYPSGGFDDETMDILDEHQIEIAFSTRRGVNEIGVDHRLLLRRVLVNPQTTEPVLRAELLPWSTRLSRWRTPPHAGTRLAAPPAATSRAT